MRNLLGGKGANLAEMTGLGLPVQGFTVTTEACIRYYRDGKVIAKEIEDQIYECLSKTEQIVGKKFETQKPVSCFSTFRCPCIDAGMMDTILNLGLNDEVVEGLAQLTQNPVLLMIATDALLQCFQML